MVLVLSVIKLVVATVEGNVLFKGLWGLLVLMAFALGSLWAVLCRWPKQQSEFPSAGAMTNALPE